MRDPRRNWFDTADDLAGPPDGGRLQAWLYGVLIALPLIGYGIVCVITQHAWFINFRARGVPNLPQGLFREWHGRPGMALGLFFVFLGALTHVHWFWANSPRLSRYYEIGELISLIGLIGSLGWWIYEIVL